MLDIIEGWAEEEKSHSPEERARQLARLAARIEHLRDTGWLPENFPPGDLKRSVADAQVRAIEREAECLGFVPPARQLAGEAVREIARTHTGGLGIADDDSEPSRSTARSREGGLGLGPELTPWSV
ncbi:MAG: hypothetical protein ACP5M3_07480 [Acidithiobacillus sp.]